MPGGRKELEEHQLCEAKTIEPSVHEPPEVELKELPPDICLIERIGKTKRSKNDQKPTRNGKKTKSKEQDKEISQRSQPDQPDTVKLSQRKE
ncbi:hypothetical protein Tco_0131905 [Tanacetum coccineum]